MLSKKKTQFDILNSTRLDFNFNLIYNDNQIKILNFIWRIQKREQTQS